MLQYLEVLLKSNFFNGERGGKDNINKGTNKKDRDEQDVSKLPADLPALRKPRRPGVVGEMGKGK